MKEKIDLQEIMKRVLPKWLDKKELKLEVRVVKPAVKVNILDKNGRVLFWGMSMCSPEDDWDISIGLALAIIRLKINANAYFKKQRKKNKQFIPKLGDVYFIPYMDEHTRKVFANKIVWTDSDLDYIRLSLGNVYRTEREARKAIRRNIFNGRHIVKESKKNG